MDSRILLSRQYVKCIVSFVTVCLVSCTRERVLPSTNAPDIIEDAYKEWILTPKGAPVRLCAGIEPLAKIVEYKWYEIIEGTDVLLDRAANANYIDVQGFNAPGIRDFLCVGLYEIDDNTQEFVRYPFHVAYTGLPVVYVDTEEAQPVISKAEKVPGYMSVIMPDGGGRI